MKESISVFLKRLSDILEFVISFILTAGIILLCLRVAGAIYKIPDLNVWPKRRSSGNLLQSDHRCRAY